MIVKLLILFLSVLEISCFRIKSDSQSLAQQEINLIPYLETKLAQEKLSHKHKKLNLNQIYPDTDTLNWFPMKDE